ncbi:kelch-like protein 26 [Ruditapes philippinarum]|uniref:kelch-like protein 26 n=1 Tax=Ruditapes philippinarum TaxID=129788 RepID=UPI00295B23F6|nr:kelch-like protein 26 [Ruditapes philippinarum]XP_060556773.1 kelch-like protein 26 [Ruditapes philippinarum]XP_060556774.1 kelch-like protein 26 [Ruditapes philippinarum]XP_060556775.1 kelch-like protein 26 [Ruditapes philippinarum]
MATGQQLTNGDAGNEVQEGEAVVQKSPLDYIYISEHKLKYINNDYKKVNAKMYDYKCDVKLTVGKSNFKGHKKVLADASDYFAAMFSHEMKEKDETIIDLKDISPEGFGAMLDYFYHGHVTVEAKIIPDILEAARFFHVEWILDICCDYMIRHLSLLNYQLTMHLADKFSLGDLRWEIFKYFSNNLPSLVEKEDFMKDCSFDLLLQFLMEYVYVEVSEFFLLQLIVNWVKADEASRKDQLQPLLLQLRFHTMELEELEAIPDEILALPEIKDEIEDAKMYCLNIPAQCLKTGDKYLSRGSREVVMIGTFNDQAESNTVVYKDLENDESNLFIEQLGQSGLACDYSTMSQAKIGNFLFAAGGYDDDYKSSSRVFRYDPQAREWTEVAMMIQPRVSFALCSSKDRLYAVGGVFHTMGDIEGGEQILRFVEMYNPEENSWKDLADLPFGTFDQASAHYDKTLYVSGGISDLPQHTIPIKSMFCLGEGANDWTELPDMTVARQGHSMTGFGGKIYIIGGYTSKLDTPGFADSFTNDMFDIETKQWTSLVSTPENLGHLYRHTDYSESTIYFLCNLDSEVFLCSFDMESQEFGQMIFVGSGVQKCAVLQIAYPSN